MCGITGIVRSAGGQVSAETLKAMTDVIAHRGPDDSGLAWFRSDGGAVGGDGDWSVALGHRRLSILDLSPAGHQPMTRDGKVWITYNGEVYNFVELRGELEKAGHEFKSQSDTEVILAAYAQWGTSCFRRFRGMWGMMIADFHKRKVILCRDRIGIKPLYYWKYQGSVFVASEIKQFSKIPAFRARVNPQAAAEYLGQGYENPVRSLFDTVETVPGGCWIEMDVAAPSPRISAPQSYWEPERVSVSVTDANEASRLFLDKFRESVALHLRSDVPVGCALSGGLDSSSIAALVHELNGPQGALHCFSTIYPGDKADEREFIDAALSGIRAEPHMVSPRPGEFLRDLDLLLWHQDEPIGSASIYNGFRLSRMTREAGVPVTLNGQGGDEILGGYYQSFLMYLRAAIRRKQLIPLLEHSAGALLPGGNPDLLRELPRFARRFKHRKRKSNLIRVKNHERGSGVSGMFEQALSADEQNRRVFDIRAMYLPRLLKWDDRNSMAFSVEGRYPLLDHELIELCLSFSPRVLYHRGWTKWPLRLGMGRLLTEKVLWRRDKLGWGVPQQRWLQQEFRPTLESWLNSDSPLWSLVEPNDVRSVANGAWSRRNNTEHGEILFRLFMFDRWMRVFHIN
ncbi:MAG: Asparagine synthetase [glutamine-hydrolyzing] 1 [Myxococcota bacterium]|nr:Asparagine synthetase [glutamine-hydrolyzing] 1 [Myxococcota bacterium]